MFWVDKQIYGQNLCLTNEQSEYMIYPRIAALSEAVWSPKESKDWNNFSSRVKQLFKRYDVKGLNYAKSVYLVSSNSQISLEKQVRFLWC